MGKIGASYKYLRKCPCEAKSDFFGDPSRYFFSKFANRRFIENFDDFGKCRLDFACFGCCDQNQQIRKSSQYVQLQVFLWAAKVTV